MPVKSKATGLNFLYNEKFLKNTTDFMIDFTLLLSDISAQTPQKLRAARPH